MSLPKFLQKHVRSADFQSLPSDARWLFLALTDLRTAPAGLLSLAHPDVSRWTGLSFARVDAAADALLDASMIRRFGHCVLLCADGGENLVDAMPTAVLADRVLRRMLRVERASMPFPAAAWTAIADAVRGHLDNMPWLSTFCDACESRAVAAPDMPSDWQYPGRNDHDQATGTGFDTRALSSLLARHTEDVAGKVAQACMAQTSLLVTQVASSVADACSRSFLEALPTVIRDLHPVWPQDFSASSGSYTVHKPDEDKQEKTVCEQTVDVMLQDIAASSATHVGTPEIVSTRNDPVDIPRTASETDGTFNLFPTEPTPLVVIDGKKAKTRKPAKVRTDDEPARAAARAVWSAYATAYESRYKVPPVRNAMANGIVRKLLERLSADEAPAVAAWYLEVNNKFYLTKSHDIRYLLHDAEALRTSWITGRQVTEKLAREADQMQGWTETANASADPMTPDQWLEEETHWRLEHNESLDGIVQQIPKGCFFNDRYRAWLATTTETQEDMLRRREKMVRDIVFEVTGNEIIPQENDANAAGMLFLPARGQPLVLSR